MTTLTDMRYATTMTATKLDIAFFTQAVMDGAIDFLEIPSASDPIYGQYLVVLDEDDFSICPSLDELLEVFNFVEEGVTDATDRTKLTYKN